MTDTITATVRRHVEAITSMLLGDRTLGTGMAITGGNRLDAIGRLQMAQLAVDSDTDVIHLEFTFGEDSATYSGITIFAPRDRGCHIHPGCRLSFPRGARSAVIVPPDHVRGHFVVDPREIRHLHAKPGEGIARAEQRLRRLVSQGVDVNGQIVLHEVP